MIPHRLAQKRDVRRLGQRRGLACHRDFGPGRGEVRQGSHRLCNNESDGSTNGSLPASAVSVSGKDASLTLKSGCAFTGNSALGTVEAAIYNDGATVTNEGCAFKDNTSENGADPNYAGDGKLKGDPIEG